MKKLMLAMATLSVSLCFTMANAQKLRVNDSFQLHGPIDMKVTEINSSKVIFYTHPTHLDADDFYDYVKKPLPEYFPKMVNEALIKLKYDQRVSSCQVEKTIVPHYHYDVSCEIEQPSHNLNVAELK